MPFCGIAQILKTEYQNAAYSDNDEYRHRFCEQGEYSWCKFQKDKVTGKKTHRNKINIPFWIHEIIKPIFTDLTDDSLLSKCLWKKNLI